MSKQTEREGFEPSVPVRVRVLSRDVLSTSQPPFQDSHTTGESWASYLLLLFSARLSYIEAGGSTFFPFNPLK